MLNKISVLISLLMCNTLLIFGQAGTLDIGFNTDGKVTTDLGGNFNHCYSIALQANGKILIAGTSNFGNNNEFVLLRYENNGLLDNTFNSDGKVITQIGNNNDIGRAIAVQPDGKILMAGYSDNGSNYDFALVRYNINGLPDSTFGNHGMVTTAIGNGDDIGYALAIQPDGKILVAGYSANNMNNDFALVRYNTDGVLDISFNSDGKVTTDFGNNDKGWSVVIQTDGKILVAGVAEIGPGNDFALARYDTAGLLDNTFDADGKVTTDFGNFDEGRSVTIQPDGKIVVAGYTWDAINSRLDYALTRYNPNGQLDNNFNNDGKIITDLGGDAQGRSVIVQPDGKIVVVGHSHNGIDFDFSLVRYHINGIVDSVFGINGIVRTDFGNGNDWGESVILQPDGKILVAGYTWNGTTFDMGVAKYISGLNVGIIGFSDHDNITLVYPNPINTSALLEFELIANDRVDIILYDMNGRLVQYFSRSEYLLKGQHKVELSFNTSIEPGNYLLAIRNSMGGQSIRIVKQ